MTFGSGPEGDNHVWDVMIEKGCSEGWDCFKTMNQQWRFFSFFKVSNKHCGFLLSLTLY